MNVMHHFTDLDAAIGELNRVLRPNGRLLLVDESFDDPSHPEHERFGARRAKSGLHFDHVDPANVASLLAAAGFTVQEASARQFNGRPAKVIRAVKA